MRRSHTTSIVGEDNVTKLRFGFVGQTFHPRPKFVFKSEQSRKTSRVQPDLSHISSVHDDSTTPSISSGMSKTAMHAVDRPGTAARSAYDDVEPVAYHSDALEELLVRAQSWVAAADNLRNNIKLLVQAEKECAQRIRKIAVGQDAIVSFHVTQRPCDEKGVTTKDSLTVAATDCFKSFPLQLAVHHEEIAKALTAIENGKAKEVQKAAKNHKTAIESTVISLWESVAGTRDALREKSKTVKSTEAAQGGEVDLWLLRVQEAAARRQERDVSSTFCQQVSTLWAEVREIEEVLVPRMGEVMSSLMTAQSASLVKLDADVQAHCRTIRSMDGGADWQLFATQPRVAKSITTPPAHTDWRSWSGAGTEKALADEARGNVMACGGDGEVVVSGLLQRQGTVIKFNWHKHFFVLTAAGFLHYFPSQSDCNPDASFYLPGSRVELGVDKGIMTILLHSKNKSWFSSGAPTKLVVQTDSTSQTPLDEWERALSGFAVPLPSEPDAEEEQ